MHVVGASAAAVAAFHGGIKRDGGIATTPALVCAWLCVIRQRIGSQDSSLREGGWKETETGAFSATLNRSTRETTSVEARNVNGLCRDILRNKNSLEGTFSSFVLA